MSKAFSSKITDDPKLFLLYLDEARCVLDKDADRLLRAILKDFDFFPKLKSFSEYCNAFKSAVSPKAEVKNKVRCDYCTDKGIIYDKLHDNITLLLICPMCEKGRSEKRDVFRYYTEKYDMAELEKVKEENIRFREQMGDPKEYFFRMMEKWGQKKMTVDGR